MTLMTKQDNTCEFEKISQDQSVRYDLVEQIRRQVRSGTYETDVKIDVCAQKLLHLFQNPTNDIQLDD